MNWLRDCAVVLGLAGMILMVSADTKDVEATGKISYKSETEKEYRCITAGSLTAEISQETYESIQEALLMEEKARAEAEAAAKAAEEEKARAAQEQAEAQAAAEAEAVQAADGRIYEVSQEDYDALLRLVEAEASGEDIKGKMLVANVVLNRVHSSSFPDTVKEVIYQCRNGRAQFSPVATGKIDRVSVSEETVEAVERVLCGEDESAGALYFVSPAYADAENHQWFRNNLTLLFAYKGHEFYA